MKRILKRGMALFLTAAFSVSLLSGCGGTEAVQEEKKTEQQESSGEKAEDASPVKISILEKDLNADDESSVRLIEAVSKGVSKQLGREVTIEIVPISEGSYSENMGLLLQGGEIPDLMYFQGGDYQFGVTQQILEDLTPYIENSVYVKAMMKEYNTKRIGNYPYLLWLSPDRIKVPVVREDWFQAASSGKALLENPSPENYKAFFQELKEKNNLQAAYTVPGDLTELDTVFNQAFGIDKTWINQDGAYVYHKVCRAQKEKLAYYADLYKEGLLDAQWLTKKWDTKESAFYNGEVGVVAGTQGSVVDIYDQKMTAQNGAAAKLKVLPPAKGAAQGYLPSDVSKESRGWAISAYSENKDAAFAVLEYMASPEGQILDKLGYEGEHYNITEGKYELTDKFSEWYPRFHESIDQLKADFSDKTPYYSEAALSSLEMASRYTTYDNSFVLPDEYVTNWDAGEALYAEFAADVISGRKSIDEFEEYVKQWNELGGSEITAYANEIIQ